MKRHWHVRVDREPGWSFGWFDLKAHDNVGGGRSYGWRWFLIWWTER